MEFLSAVLQFCYDTLGHQGKKIDKIVRNTFNDEHINIVIDVLLKTSVITKHKFKYTQKTTSTRN